MTHGGLAGVIRGGGRGVCECGSLVREREPGRFAEN